jgi:SAM-dependent methyltransferase
MKNKENWKPSKFVFKKGKLRASRDEKQVGYSSRLVADIIAKFYDHTIKKHVSGNLLDLGCGKVPLYEAYSPFIDDNFCVDWVNSFHKNEFLDMSADLNAPIAIEDNRFDTIILSDVLEHIKEPKLLWNEMARIIKEEGTLIMNVPFFYWLHEEPFDYFRYTKHSLKQMANESGFEIIEIQSLGGVPEILADMIAKTIRRVPILGKSIVGKSISKMIQSLTWLFINTSIGQKASRATRDQFPIAYGLIAKKQYNKRNKNH